MTRRTAILVGVILALLWSSRFIVDSGGAGPAGDSVAEAARGDEAARAGAWWRAARYFGRAFAFGDPRDPARRPRRAELARLTAWAYTHVITEADAGLVARERDAAEALSRTWSRTARALASAEPGAEPNAPGGR